MQQEFTREWNDSRRAQGFRSQAHLDAFYAAYDHQKTCQDCQGVWYALLDDGYQPYQKCCPEWHRLDRIATALSGSTFGQV